MISISVTLWDGGGAPHYTSESYMLEAAVDETHAKWFYFISFYLRMSPVVCVYH